MDIMISNQKFSGLPFEEAFSLARSEMGSRGIFIWNGQPFNTLLKEEQDAMSPAEWSEFSSAIQSTLRDSGLGSLLASGGHTSVPQAEIYEPENLSTGMQPEPPAALLASLGVGTTVPTVPAEVPSGSGGGFFDFLAEFFGD